MKTKILFSAMLMVFLLNVTKAQSHKVGQANYNCKLNKKGWFFNSEKLPCPACDVTEKKEKAAKAAEDKRRNDVVVAKAKADKVASDLAYKKKQQEIAEKNKVTEVAVMMPKSNAVNSNISIKKIGEVNDQNILIGKIVMLNNGVFGGLFENEKGERILTNDNWRYALSIKERSLAYDYKTNIGIVRCAEPDVTDRSLNYKNSYFNIVNYKGEHLLPDNESIGILHIKDNWFFISNRNAKEYLINITSKKKIELENLTKRTITIEHEAAQYFPIFSDATKLLNNDVFSARSKEYKNILTKLKPKVINENILKQYNFVIIHTNYVDGLKALFHKIDEISTAEYIIVLYCFSKEGKMTKITL